MKYIKYLFAIFSIFLFSSCLVRTIFPLFNDNEIISEPELIGKWVNQDSSETWEFSKYDINDTTRNQKKYRLLTIGVDKIGKKDTVVFEAMTGLIGKNIFLDVILDQAVLDQKIFHNPRYSNQLVYTHIFYKVNIKNDSLSLSEMDKDWFSKNQKKIKISVIPRDDGDYITIISRTPELQKFIKKYANDNKAFHDLQFLKRIN